MWKHSLYSLAFVFLREVDLILHAGQNEALFYQPVRVSVRLRPNTPQKPGANALRLIPRYQPRKV